ncbi:LOW QUALITY PROTEIN: protein scarlet-like [Uranotaenia lowii]|uniref:LOW QUALITY PROTEIN: protein scarlet-like n=1 Tax=Uranotaenia lowii TaxID=190385 RepID=UPI00247A2AD7|nr:LOW QUALITY PROTEIN: protein scarlet-like [Uranotaenia lowii]
MNEGGGSIPSTEDEEDSVYEDEEHLEDSVVAGPSNEFHSPMDVNSESSSVESKATRLRVYTESSTFTGPWVVFIRPKKNGKQLNVVQITRDLARWSSVTCIKKVRPNKLRVEVANRKSANEIAASNFINLEYHVYIPSRDVEIEGVITEMSLKAEYVKSNGVDLICDRLKGGLAMDKQALHLELLESARSLGSGVWSNCSKDSVTLVWKNVNIETKPNGRGKNLEIVTNVSGSLLPGTLVALMGPSGAGKSTLMAALAHRSSGNTTVAGDILVNGVPIDSFMYDISGFIYQDEVFCGSITVEEHLHLIANLKFGHLLSPSDKTILVDDLIRKMSLQKCRHTLIGDVGESKTISGGEKKRLAFAAELLSQPKILFCDEPTTGLDSFSAAQLVRTMKDLTRSGTSIICTIHQPSDELFYMFDGVIMLASGRVGFIGDPNEAVSYFTNLNYSRGANSATSDFLIECLSNRKSNEICDRFYASEAFQKQQLIIASEYFKTDRSQKSKNMLRWKYPKAAWFYVVRCLIWRNILQAHRNCQLQYMKLTQRVVIGLLVALCFSDSIEMTQPGAQAVQGIIFLIVSENTFLPMYAVLSVFPDSFPLFLRERKANLYGTVQFYVSQIVAMLPFVLLESLAFIVIVYYIGHMRPTLLGMLGTAAASILVMNVSMACGCFFSTVFPSVPMAMSYLVPFDYILMITSGIFIRIRTIPSYLRWMPYISWMMFASEAISITQWDGIERIECSGMPKRACLHTGDDVLQQYSFQGDHLQRDFVVLILQYFMYHGLAVLFLIRKTMVQ